jgi:acyl transferase domain-containing protein
MSPKSPSDGGPFPFLVSTLPGWPDVSLLRAAARAGASAVLTLEAVAPDDAQASFAALAHNTPGRVGVRLDAFSQLDRWPAPLIDAIAVVVVAAGGGAREIVRVLGRPGRTILIECTTVEEARAAAALTPQGLIAKGHEAGGHVGEETTFVLLQRLLAETALPIWAHGGIGTHTIAACAVAGCAGVVLDAQLALARESTLPEPVGMAIGRMGGDETTCLGSTLDARYRVFTRADLRAPEALRLVEADLAGRRAGNADAIRERWLDEVRARINWRPPGDSLWPLGQDAAFAAPLARRFRSVAGMLHGLRQALDAHLDDARQLGPLDRGAPLAAAHGTQYPILQGPMTRVSDTAGFARAVADAGGLPFLACALLRAPRLRALLSETKELLGDRRWGVGILGFVPPELREEQLRVIEEFGPPFALIAGGRPDQAATLEKQGIPTYLHVPAPALLRMFLDAGARRFIFEGRECGGHVGPRTSFVLWESMVDVLLAAVDAGVPAGELHVVFAGGIHDARSAAMVAATGAPLAGIGVRIGVLMGTAYLFTTEAVETGAIVDGFQQEALQCARTVLLESGPGHATRCADTAFCATFQETRRRLIDEGKAGDDIRLALETLNLGRLRIASKGITRDDTRAASGRPDDPTGYVRLPEAKQRRDGMYMIGQVAALRDRICRIADLHEAVAVGGTVLLRESAAQRRAAPAVVVPEPAAALSASVAIIGMGCLLPKAHDVRTLWHNLLNKVDAIGEIPAERFDAARYYDSDRRAADKIYSKWGGFLEEIPFDPVKYGIPPAAMPSIDPFQLLTLEAVHQALGDAGYADRAFDRERTSVILGASGGGGELGYRYGIRAGLPTYLDHVPQATLARLPEWTEDSFAGVLLNVAAGRVANRLNLGGLNFTVDAACASSLAAVYVAARELEAGASDMTIVGGIDTVNSPFGFLCFSSAQALSPTGRCRTFDETADGIAISEGLVVLVLKRLADAERDGDRVYAVIRAVAGSSDGRGKGLTAPRPEGQMRVLQRAYAASGLSPSTVGLVEAHGTGTVAGDSAEVAALSRVYGAAGAAPASCALGSIKSMIGHTKSAAGVSGLMKVALALHHKILPPTLHVTTPNAQLREENTPFFVNTQAQPWIAPAAAEPRRAAVSSFGFGGTNFHVVVEEYAGDAPGMMPEVSPAERWPAELAFWAARSREDLLAALGRAEEALSRAPETPLRDAAAAICRSTAPATSAPARLAIVAGTLRELRDRMALVRHGLQGGHAPALPSDRGIYFGEQTEPAGKVAFLFPGQGSQYPGMHRDLAVHFPELRHSLEIADRITARRYPKRLSAYVLPPPAFAKDHADRQLQELTDTAIAQPALGAVEAGLCRLLGRLGIRPDLTAGHSYGEYVALAAGGAFSQETLFALSEARGRLIKTAAGAEPGTMAAVGASPDAITRALGTLDGVWIANVNSPSQTVLAGRTSAIDAAVAALSAAGMMARRIPVACAFHSPLVEAAGRSMSAVLADAPLDAPRIPVFSNTLGAAYPADTEKIRRILADHITSPVRFADEIEAMYAAGARIFVEVGPRGVLSGLARETLAEVDRLIVPLDAPDTPGVVQLLSAIAQLAVAGVPVDFEELWRGRAVARVPLARLAPAAAPPEHAWMVSGGNARRRSVSAPAAVVHAPQNPAPAPVSLVAAPTKPTPGSASPSVRGPSMEQDRPLTLQPTPNDSPDVMQQFQQLMSQFLHTQAVVMTTYLQGSGSPAAIPAAAAPPPMPAPHPAPIRSLIAPVAERPADAAPASPPAAPVVAIAPAPVPAPERRERVPSSVPGTSLAEVLSQLLQIVSDRTGYPEDMLDADANIEADLGIDSIKRMEILAAFQQLHAGAARGDFQGVMEKLTTLKTLRETAAALADVLEGQAEAVA